MNYLPQLRFEFSEILEDGSEIISSTLTEGRLMMEPRNNESNNPLNVSVEINKALGSHNDTCSVTVENSPFIEELRANYDELLEKIRDTYFRVRIWAWYQPSDGAEPAMSPVFVGDMINSFGVSSQSITGSSFQFTAHSAGWLALDKPHRFTYLADSYPSYFEVVEHVFDEIIARGYGRETPQSAELKIIFDPNEKLKSKLLKRPDNVNASIFDYLDRICSDLDMVWGIHNQIPYIMCRSTYFDDPAVVPQEIVEGLPNLNFERSLNSMVDYGMYDFGFNCRIDNNLVVGEPVFVNQKPQTSDNNEVFGRISEINYSLSTKTGHGCRVNANYVDASIDEVALPRDNYQNRGHADV